MKKLFALLLLCSLSFTNSFAGGTLNAEDISVRKMWNKIQHELRIPARVITLHEGEKPEVHFTFDAIGNLQVLEIENATPFLEKQLRNSFENIKNAGTPLMSGQRFSIQLKLQ
jgi:hypothetical protein